MGGKPTTGRNICTSRDLRLPNSLNCKNIFTTLSTVIPTFIGNGSQWESRQASSSSVKDCSGNAWRQRAKTRFSCTTCRRSACAQ
eukprot:2582735-Rhodomonas_salina.1